MEQKIFSLSEYAQQVREEVQKIEEEYNKARGVVTDADPGTDNKTEH